VVARHHALCRAAIGARAADGAAEISGALRQRLVSWAGQRCGRAASAWRQLNLPKSRLEPLLEARAEELSPGRIRFGHELTGLEQDDEGVRATIRDHASGPHAWIDDEEGKRRPMKDPGAQASAAAGLR
jgi:2-polyprenyl-6-methoxyphenol hydroxylase-like FAD-dependent oxidoreductase